MKIRNLVIFSIAIFATAQLSAQKLSTRSGMVKFYSEAPLENIEAVNKQVSSIINTETGDFAFLVPIKGFIFEKALMQEHFNERYMESGKYSNGTFKGKIDNLEEVDFKKDGTYEVVFSGMMNIHGKEQKLTKKGTLTVKGGKAKLNSKFNLKVRDYDVEIPASKSENISNELEVTVAIDYDK